MKYKLFQIGTTPEEMTEKENQHPYIVAYGYSKKEIVSFYIEAERHLIPVRFEFDMKLSPLFKICNYFYHCFSFHLTIRLNGFSMFISSCTSCLALVSVSHWKTWLFLFNASFMVCGKEKQALLPCRHFLTNCWFEMWCDFLSIQWHLRFFYILLQITKSELY